MSGEQKRDRFSQWIDWFFNKAIPKKFMVWVIATIGLFMAIVPGEIWGYISMIYISANAIQKFSPNNGIEFKQKKE